MRLKGVLFFFATLGLVSGDWERLRFLWVDLTAAGEETGRGTAVGAGLDEAEEVEEEVEEPEVEAVVEVTFLAVVPLRVALESVEDLRSAELDWSGTFEAGTSLDFDFWDLDFGATGASDSLLDGLVSEDDEDGSGFSGVELLILFLDFLWASTDTLDTCSGTVVIGIFGAPAALAGFLTVSTFFFFFAGAEVSESDSEPDPELEADDDESLDLRFSLLTRLPTVDFMLGALGAKAPFSSSASLSELEVEEDPEDMIVVFVLYLDALEVVTPFISVALPSPSSLLESLPLLLVSSAPLALSSSNFNFFFAILARFVTASSSSSLLVISSSRLSCHSLNHSL